MVNKRLSDIAHLLNGFAFKSSKYVEHGIRIIRIANVQDGYITDEKPCYYPVNEVATQYSLVENDILVSLTGNVGRVGLMKAKFLPAALNQRVCCIRNKDNNSVNIKYLFYYLRRKHFMQECIKVSKGMAQLNLSTKWLENYIVPVPSIEKQERIVSRIEELFSELDAGVETLQKIKQQLSVYRQAVLKDAFSKCKQHVSVNSVCSHVTDGDHLPPPKEETGIPFIMISNIEDNHINWNNTAYVGRAYYDSISDKRRPQKGDVLYTVTGSFGIPVMIDFDKEFCFQRHIALLRPNEKIEQKYLFYAMQNPTVYAQADKRSTGTAQKTVGLAVLRDIQIPFCESKSDQMRLISKIEQRLESCKLIEKDVNQALQQSVAMRQSILKQAFEGGL